MGSSGSMASSRGSHQQHGGQAHHGLLGSCFVIFIAAVLYEGFKLCLRDMVQKMTMAPAESDSSNQLMLNSEEEEVNQDDGPSLINEETNEIQQQEVVSIEMRPKVKGRISCLGHGIQTLLHLIQVLTSYLLMLIFMTYNVWLCAAVALGAATGYAIFGRYKPTDSGLSALSEHCN